MTRARRPSRAWLAAAALWLGGTLAIAAPGSGRACEIALVLAMDVSGSVDAAEYRLQADGLVAALGDSAVQEAILQAEAALSVTQWSGIDQQEVSIDWQRMHDHGAIGRFAAQVEAMPRRFHGGETAVGAALDFALDQFAAVPDCGRRIVDMSGDGAENVGFTITRARSRARDAGVQVNALAIEGMGRAITNFYHNWVITPDGFVITAQGHLGYREAIRAKLLRELSRPLS